MGSRGFSYYYSLTHLRVSGAIYYHGHWIHVHGIAWLDHQWGSWQWSQIRGWTWGGFHLDNSVDFSLSDFHASGASLHGVSVSFPGGAQRTVKDVSIAKTGTWKSPRDGAVYSSGWKVSIPALNAHLTVSPLIRNQEMYDRLAPPESYWEGACSVTGTFMGKHVAGHAYMELVGASGHFGSF
jgi:predicted secreted hydrolase